MVNGVRDMQSAMPHGGSASPLPRHQHALEDAAFLAEFDLTLPGLAAGRLNTARAALVEHFRHRRSPRWVMDLRAHAEPIEVLFHVWIPRVIPTGTPCCTAPTSRVPIASPLPRA